MHHAGLAESSSMPLADPVGGLRRRLQDQEQLLQGVIARFADARRALGPDRGDGEWHGPAQLAYALGLARLHSELDTAGSHLESALRETRRALYTLDSRVG